MLDHTLTMVSSAHCLVRAASACPPQMSTTDLAVVVDGDRRTELLTGGERVRQCVGDLVEPGVTMAVHDFSHLHIIRCGGCMQLANNSFK